MVSCVLILISSYFIFLAVNNLLKGFNYPNFELMIKYREIEIYNKTASKENKLDVVEIITDKIIMYADESTIINDKRGYDLSNARKYIILNFMLAISNIIIVTSINILK